MSEPFMYMRKKKNKYYTALAIFLVFVSILGYMLLTSFYPKLSLTGKIIDEVRPNSTITISAELGIPELKVSGDFKSVKISGNSESPLYIEGSKFPLASKNNFLVFENFTGDVNFDQNEISKISGKALRVSVNGVPMEPRIKGTTLKISVDDFNYNDLGIEDEVVIKEISYSTSGSININNGKNIFSLDGEQIIVEDFVGDLKILGGKFKLDGFVKKLDINGKSAITISS